MPAEEGFWCERDRCKLSGPMTCLTRQARNEAGQNGRGRRVREAAYDQCLDCAQGKALRKSEPDLWGKARKDSRQSPQEKAGKRGRAGAPVKRRKEKELEERDCLGCGKKFQAAGGWDNFCPECKVSRKQEPPQVATGIKERTEPPPLTGQGKKETKMANFEDRKCECGKTFTPAGPRQKYCPECQAIRKPGGKAAKKPAAAKKKAVKKKAARPPRKPRESQEVKDAREGLLKLRIPKAMANRYIKQAVAEGAKSAEDILKKALQYHDGKEPEKAGEAAPGPLALNAVPENIEGVDFAAPPSPERILSEDGLMEFVFQGYPDLLRQVQQSAHANCRTLRLEVVALVAKRIERKQILEALKRDAA